MNLRVKQYLFKLQYVQFTQTIKNSFFARCHRHCMKSSSKFYNFSRMTFSERCLPPLFFSGFVFCHQNSFPVTIEKSYTFNSPRSFYMQSPKYVTLTHELVPQLKAPFMISEHSPSESKMDATSSVHIPWSDSVKFNVTELVSLHTSLVQDVYNRNCDFFIKGINSIGTLDNDILKDCFRLFAKLKNVDQRVIKTFEQKCCDQMDLWSVETVLLVCDAFHLVNYHASLFNMRMYDYMEKRIQSLSKHNIIQLTFLIGENRKVPFLLFKKLQKRMLDFKDLFTVCEIGVICNGLFKSQTRITAKRLLTNFEKCIKLEDLRAVDSHSIVGICKMYRYSYFGSESLFSKIACEIVNRIPSLHIEAITHIALTYSTLHMFHAPLMNAIAECYVWKIKHSRCKDVTKCLWSMNTLAHVPPNANKFYNVAVSEIRTRLVEYKRFPNQLTAALLALAYVDIYPLDLIHYIFSSEVLDSIRKYKQISGIDLRPDLHLLNSALSIDRPLFRENKLLKDFLKEAKLPDDVHANLGQEINKRQFLKPVISSISQILEDSNVINPRFILPYMKTIGIELRLSHQSNELIPVTEWENLNANVRTISPASAMVQKIIEQTSIPPENELKLNETGITRIAVMLWSRNHYRFGAKENVESRCLLGLHAMKRRHLMLLGYKIIDLPFFELEHIVGKEQDLNQYLRSKLEILYTK
ncbi:FAST kinase domain-containing protein 5, mitochondrial-like [Antedon mediterranea]|uniref:FAST kinase domain-containing protein 5, mitochondrial-like n=1 Tax=Antedon mediterranea TaxID=105859 RepID=UPI003AF54F96